MNIMVYLTTLIIIPIISIITCTVIITTMIIIIIIVITIKNITTESKHNYLQVTLSHRNGTGNYDSSATYTLPVGGIVTPYARIDILSRAPANAEMRILELKMYTGHGENYRIDLTNETWHLNVWLPKAIMELRITSDAHHSPRKMHDHLRN